MDKLTQAFQFRHACKIFDETKTISDQDINYILEAGRQSPSSFGMEPWHFLVVTDEKLKTDLRTACYNQPQITSCSHLVIALYRKSEQFTMQSEYLRRATQRSLTDEGSAADLDAACQYFTNYTNSLPEGTDVNNWSEIQCYLPCANMMTAAAYIGLDSCAIGGFQPEKLLEIIENLAPKFNKHSFGVALCVALGYRKNPQPSQIRWSLDDITTFL